MIDPNNLLERTARIEALLPHLATKEELVKVRVDLFDRPDLHNSIGNWGPVREFLWRHLPAWMVGFVTALWVILVPMACTGRLSP